mmetsp:Transcript_56462/g.83918  ORF Transcript_56462/g.83918 Transcript_56462/m.83918 type:complete len:366 (+) Transcript_56462:1100-2197(+)
MACLPLVLIDKIFSSISSHFFARFGIDIKDHDIDHGDNKGDITYWSRAGNGTIRVIQTLFAIPAIPFFFVDRMWSKTFFDASTAVPANSTQNDNTDSHGNNVNYWDSSIHGIQIVAKAPFSIAASPFMVFDSLWCSMSSHCRHNINIDKNQKEEYYWEKVKRGALKVLQAPFMLVALPFVGIDTIAQRTNVFENLPSASLLFSKGEREKMNETRQLQDQEGVMSTSSKENINSSNEIVVDAYWQKAQRGGIQTVLIPVILFALPLAGVDFVWSNIMTNLSNHSHPSSCQKSTMSTNKSFWNRAMQGGLHVLSIPFAALVAPFAGWGAILSWKPEGKNQHYDCYNIDDNYWTTAYVGGRALFGFFS